jgi:hypothetical protein
MCSAPPNKAYLEPIISCANKCRPRWFHLRCVGLQHFPYNNAPWYCPSCQIERGIQYDSQRVCICDVAPYQSGPMVECTKREDCATRWFHLPCVGDAYVEGDEWYCLDCVVDPFDEQEQEQGQEQEVRHSQEDQQTGNVMVNFTGDLEMSDPDDEFQQQEWASDGLPGTFLGEDADPRRQSPGLDVQVPTSAALDVAMAEATQDELPVQEEENHERVSAASLAARAHSAPAQLGKLVDFTQPEPTPPVSRQPTPQESRQATPRLSRQATPQVSRQATPQASRQPSLRSSLEPEVTARVEEDALVVLPEIEEEATVILSNANREDTPGLLLPTNEATHTIQPASDGDALAQEIGLPASGGKRKRLAQDDDEQEDTPKRKRHHTEEEPEAEVPPQEAASDGEIDQEEEQASHLCRPGCTVNDNSGPMVACDGSCTGQWYHYACVGITVKPKSSREWFCPECRIERRNAKKRGATQQGQPSNAPALQPTQPAVQQAQPIIAAPQPSQSPSRPSRSKRATRQTTEPEYCTCGTPADNDMIACDGHCAREWFHFACVGLTAESIPEGEWYCDDCAAENRRTKKSKNVRREKKKDVRRKA